LPCFVTSALWGGNPFLFRSSASNSMVFFATRCCVLMSAFDLLDGSYSSSMVASIFAPWVLVSPTPNPLAHPACMEPLQQPLGPSQFAWPWWFVTIPSQQLFHYPW
jgi:hypothetical protein